MAKFLNENKTPKKQKAAEKKQTKKSGGLGFVCGMLIYAAIVLALVIYGLNFFWGYMAAYEASRPYIAVDSYMELVTDEYICDRSAELIGQIDHNIQSEEACRQVIKDAVSEGITCAKKTAECTDDRMVYVLRSGKQVIGSFVMEHRGETVHGFTPWEVVEDSFDLSYLITGTVSTTAPSHYPVYVNGNLLTEEYVTESGIEFEELEEFYGDYELPTMSTYVAGPCLGEINLTVTDPDGNEVVIDEQTDMNVFINNCTEEEVKALDTFTEAYIRSYVKFTSSVDGSNYENYANLTTYMVPNGKLAERMFDAIDGLYYAQSYADKIVSITINHRVNIGDGRYMCDVTYVVDTTGRAGVVQTINNVKIIVVETNDGLKAEAMTSY